MPDINLGFCSFGVPLLTHLCGRPPVMPIFPFLARLPLKIKAHNKVLLSPAHWP